MPQHSTKNTVSRPAYCKRCGRSTQHKVWDGRIAHCLECGIKIEPLKLIPNSVEVPIDCHCWLFKTPHDIKKHETSKLFRLMERDDRVGCVKCRTRYGHDGGEIPNRCTCGGKLVGLKELSK